MATDTFSRIVKNLIVDNAFYGTLLSHLQREYSMNVKDISFALDGINIKCLVNQEYISKTPETEVQKVIVREINHLCMKHFTQDVESNSYLFSDKALASVSFDLAACDEGCLSTPLRNMPKMQVPRWYYLHLKDPDYKDPSVPGDQSIREIDPALARAIDRKNGYSVDEELQKKLDDLYDTLDEIESTTEYDDVNNDPAYIATQKSIDTINDLIDDEPTWDEILDVDIRPHIIWDQIQETCLHTHDHGLDVYKGATIEDFSSLVTLIQEQVDFSVMSAYKSCGRGPGWCMEYIDSLLHPKAAAYDWRRAFRQMLGNCYTDNYRSSRMKESRRYEDGFGHRHQKTSKVLVGVDTSGSVSAAELADFAAEIHNIWKAGCEVTIIEGDTSIANTYQYDGTPIEGFRGRGGTNFAEFVDYWNEHYREYDGFVFLTDGEDSVQDLAPIKPMIWVISAGGYQEDVYPGKTVFIPKDYKQE